MPALIIITLGILSRLVVHTPNFSPVYSMALLAGVYLKGRQAVVVPLSLMIISDLIIGLYPGVFFTWAAIFLISIFGLWLKEKKSFVNVIGGSITAAVIFFVVSNFGSWIVLYPHTIEGLRQCYILAIPFFRSTLASTVAYSMVFYAAYEWILKTTYSSGKSRANREQSRCGEL